MKEKSKQLTGCCISPCIFKLNKMKRTKSIIVFTITMFVTWLLFAFIGYIASDYSYQECVQSNGLKMLMLLFGWIPASIVTSEYYELQVNSYHSHELPSNETKSVFKDTINN